MKDLEVSFSGSLESSTKLDLELVEVVGTYHSTLSAFTQKKKTLVYKEMKPKGYMITATKSILTYD
jgi:hypothetical protein